MPKKPKQTNKQVNCDGVDRKFIYPGFKISI